MNGTVFILSLIVLVEYAAIHVLAARAAFRNREKRAIHSRITNQRKQLHYLGCRLGTVRLELQEARAIISRAADQNAVDCL